MLGRPEYGWTRFSLGEAAYDLSYLTNIPSDWLDAAISGLETLNDFRIHGECEPGRMECTVSMRDCRVTERRKGVTSACNIVQMSMLDFCKELHGDLSAHLDEWSRWNPVYGESGEIRKSLQNKLNQLHKLISIRENCFDQNAY